MAKKPKDDPPNPHSVPHRDVLQRLNFLYQASRLLGAHAAPPPPPTHAPLPDTLHGAARRHAARERTRARHGTAPAELARTYVRNMRAIGQKTNVRMDPSVKRTLCKGCDIVLEPGRTAHVRVNPSANHGNLITHTCASCGTQRRFPAPPLVDESAAPDAAAPAAAAEVQPTAADAMPVDAPEGVSSVSQKPSSKSRRKRRPAPRIPPLFERNVGHVIFRGNERIA
ncbi:ribonuclease P protein subunit rpr2 [Phanerochaete sordida]|uniref:Ribonuclease P protein subunit rpr2 n=1 Tax=Phanerochaete sordida TaxID=48140 RepID=A0A9P3GIS6_9APHY|nr:ribonuclease P protein subunit rpr2 [Phanerochaete sordida]